MVDERFCVIEEQDIRLAPCARQIEVEVAISVHVTGGNLAYIARMAMDDLCGSIREVAVPSLRKT